MGSSPRVIALAGPNGAGKTAAADDLLRSVSGIKHFVNADTIAAGLSAFDPDAAAIQAGRVMLARLSGLAADRESFAFETTLASRTFAPRIRGLIDNGYVFEPVFLWLPSSDLSIARVASRVRQGGHFVPDEVVRRRYARGLTNFFGLYAPLATRWQMYDNASVVAPRLIAEGTLARATHVADTALWYKIRSEYDHGNAIIDPA